MFLAGKNPPYLIGPNYGTTRYVYGNPAERLYGQQGTSARTWYTVDALGSVRAVRNDAGVPQAVASYDAWGVPETPLIGSFGCTGEVQRGSDVWLRARWYGAGRGGFGARDAWAGEATRPYSLMPYQYAYANPTLFVDPTGKYVTGGAIDGDDPCAKAQQRKKGEWNGDEIALSQCLAPIIFKYAAIHAMPGARFEKATMAALMAAIVQFENGNKSFDDWQNRVLSGIANAVIPSWAKDVPYIGKGFNVTVGLPKLRPESIAQIYNCELPLENGSIYKTDFQITYTTQEAMRIHRLNAETYNGLFFVSPLSRTFDERDYSLLSSFVDSDQEFAIEMLAINLKRGIIRAQQDGRVPSVMNVASWHHTGIQDPATLLWQGRYGYGVGIATFFIKRAADNLHISLPPTVNFYNVVEGNEHQDEQQLVNMVQCRQVFCVGRPR